MPVVGTAGHVDHGKSTLVRALTGRDPDRWAEERERGLTIDLGFAWTTLPDGTEVSFVDVPGHERFMKNMLAGIEAIDVALLVVDAEEGWKPQTEEHVAVLDLLGVERGIVALTKVDRVDGDLRELARLEIEERLAGTSLEKAPIVGVSARTGEGLDDLVALIGDAVTGLPAPEEGRPRLWVDRAFTIPGAGTVATGTLLDGSIHVGDRLTVFPREVEARVRGLQTHERAAEVVEPRRRVAVNLAGVGTEVTPRGSMLGRAGQWYPSDRFLAIIRNARYVDELADRGAYHLHTGSGAWPARLRILDSATALIEITARIPVRVGDRFILRETGRRLVLAGGEIADPDPPRRMADLRRNASVLSRIASVDRDSQADLLLATRGREDLAVLSSQTGGGRPTAGAELGGKAYTKGSLDRLVATIEAAVDAHHHANPLRAGMPVAELAGLAGLPVRSLEQLVAGTDLVLDRDVLRRRDHAAGWTAEQEKAWAAAREALSAAGPSFPSPAGLGLEEEVVHALVRAGELVRVSPAIVLLPAEAERLVATLRALGEPFTVAQFKSATGLSRKYAVPFLEWADRDGITIRVGDLRRLRNRS